LIKITRFAHLFYAPWVDGFCTRNQSTNRFDYSKIRKIFEFRLFGSPDFRDRAGRKSRFPVAKNLKKTVSFGNSEEWGLFCLSFSCSVSHEALSSAVKGLSPGGRLRRVRVSTLGGRQIVINGLVINFC
jgi:hypothetical protein